jgi:hypothetical protein
MTTETERANAEVEFILDEALRLNIRIGTDGAAEAVPRGAPLFRSQHSPTSRSDHCSYYRGESAVSDDVIALRRRLRAQGFKPIPVLGKVPSLKGWQSKLETNDAEIALWVKLFPHSHNTGILTINTPTIDIDILNPFAATAVEELFRDRLDERGYIPVRFGRAPKRAIPFRTDAPFKKIAIPLIAADGDTSQKLEFLCDGQQVVIATAHSRAL